MHEVYHIHASPDCTSYSTAHSPHSAYRNADGTVDRTMPKWKQNIADRHDKVLTCVLNTIRTASAKHQNMLCTIENPVSHFQSQPVVKALLKQPGWRIGETNYCSAAIDRFDAGRPWTMKPTHIVWRGGESSLILPKCKMDCKYRLPDEEDGKPGMHKYAIRIDEKS